MPFSMSSLFRIGDLLVSSSAPDIEGVLLLRSRLGSRSFFELVVSIGVGFSSVVGLRRSSSPHREITTSTKGRSFLSTSSLASFSSTGYPETTRPKTVCFPFKCSQGAKVMKNLQSLSVRDQRTVSSIRVVLTAIGSFSTVRHTHKTFLVNLPPSEVLIVKLAAID